jgi:hypothetical protein
VGLSSVHGEMRIIADADLPNQMSSRPASSPIFTRKLIASERRAIDTDTNTLFSNRPSSGKWIDYVANKSCIKPPFFANHAKIQNTAKKYYDKFLISSHNKSWLSVLFYINPTKKIIIIIVIYCAPTYK